MKQTVSLYVVLYCSVLFAPPEGDIFSFDPRSDKNNIRTQRAEFEQRRPRQQTSTKVARKVEIEPQIIETVLPHKHQANGRSPFEDELKTAFDARRKNPKISREKSLKAAKDLWEQSQRSHIPARDFVVHLKNRYEESLHNIYSGEKNPIARTEFEADLQEISPFLYKTWRDSFFIARGKQKAEVRTDAPFFTWLDENPEYLTLPQKEHEKTPLEIACDGNSPEMAQKILHIANDHEISINTLVEPLVEKYKIIYQEKGESAAYDYLQSIYDLHVSELSHAIFENLKNINFPQNLK